MGAKISLFIALCAILGAMNIRHNSRFVWGNLIFLTTLCWIIPIIFIIAWIGQNLFDYPVGLDAQSERTLGAFSAFFLVVWLFYFLNIKFEFSARLTEEGIVKSGWRGTEMMLWQDVCDVVVKPLKGRNRVLGYYFTDKDGGVIIVPVNLFAEDNQVIDVIEERIPASVPRRLRS